MPILAGPMGIPIRVGYGGTGATTLTGVVTGNGTGALTANAVTENGVLVGGAANAVSSTAVGNAGEVLTSNGAGVAPTWQAVPGGNVAWTLVGTQAIVAAKPQIVFTGLSYTDLHLIATGITTVGNTFLVLRVSTDNGASYYSSTSDYKFDFDQTSLVTSSKISESGVTGTVEKMLISTIFGANLAGCPKTSTSQFDVTIPTISGVPIKRSALCNSIFLGSTDPINAIQLKASDGSNLTAGTVYLLGR